MGGWIKIVVAVALASVAGVTAATDAPAERAQYHNKLATAKNEATQALREVVTRKLAESFPAETRTSIYIDIAVDRFMLEHAVLDVDGFAEVSRSYSEVEALALQKRGADRLLRLNLEPGRHQFRLRFKGHIQGSEPGSLNGIVDLNENIAPDNQTFTLPVLPDDLRLGRARMRWQMQEEAEDPRLQVVRFRRDTRNTTGALLELLEIAGPIEQPAKLPAGYHSLMAHSYLDFGMREQAEQAVRSVRGVKVKKRERAELAQVWLRIAQLDYERGDFANAEVAVKSAIADLPASYSLPRQDLLSRILLARGQYRKAAALLSKVNRVLDEASEAELLALGQNLHLRYNYAVALIRSGDLDRGLTLLDRIGQSQLSEGPAAKLTEQANLALAFYFLRNAQGATAKTIFQRIPTNSFYANPALLGLGWSEMAPAGKQQARVAPETYLGEWPNAYFEQAQLKSDLQGRLHRAMVPWTELVSGKATDPSVQEALLVLANAKEQLGLNNAALIDYERAVNTYDATRSALKYLAGQLQRGQLTTAILKYSDSLLPNAGILIKFFSSHRVQEHIKNIDDINTLRKALRQFRIEGEHREPLQQAADTVVAVTQAELAQAVQKRITQLDHYHILARFGLARVLVGR